MFSFVRPEESGSEHDRILAIQERILQALEIPYRVVDIAAGDLGAAAARKFDCEAWIPSQERYRELTSCSNTTDYQARRLGVRFRPEPEAPPLHPHTLNGTAVAVGRTLIALLENGQQRRRLGRPAQRPSRRGRAAANRRSGVNRGPGWAAVRYSSCSPSSGSMVSAQELMQ